MAWRPPINDQTINGSDHDLRQRSDLCGRCGRTIGEIAILSPTVDESRRQPCKNCADDLLDW